MHLAGAAQVVHRGMFERKFSFDGSFKEGCKRDAAPQSLLALVNMIQEDLNSKYQTWVTARTNASLSISQLLMLNSVRHVRGAAS